MQYWACTTVRGLSKANANIWRSRWQHPYAEAQLPNQTHLAAHASCRPCSGCCRAARKQRPCTSSDTSSSRPPCAGWKAGQEQSFSHRQQQHSLHTACCRCPAHLTLAVWQGPCKPCPFSATHLGGRRCEGQEVRVGGCPLSLHPGLQGCDLKARRRLHNLKDRYAGATLAS